MTDYLRPIPISGPAAPPDALPLAGGPLRFCHIEVLRRQGQADVHPASEFSSADLARLTKARHPLGEVTFDTPRLMGILNTTPDSFSDGGSYVETGVAIQRAYAMLSEGADILDIGGESTRPGAVETLVDIEIARTHPVIARLRTERFPLPISLDTRKSAVARGSGAHILNDVSGLRYDPAVADCAAADDLPLILMHSIGTPEIMQDLAPDAYDNVVLDVYDALASAIAAAEARGVRRDRIVIDPGVGFGKTDMQTRALLARISLFHGLGCPILLGVSRKGFIGRTAQVADPAQRGPGSAGIGLWALSQGIQILRVHDIALHKQAIRLWCASQGLGLDS